jgi:hypothetical protein
MKLRLKWVVCAICLVLAAIAIPVSPAASRARQAPILRYWPNEESKANSDDWIHFHHDQIYQLRPNLLVLNFANGMVKDKAYQNLTELMIALRESSRYHGYSQDNATPALTYRLFKYVDLTDKDPLPDDQVLDGNSSLYPRVPNWKEGLNLKYDELFTDRFAMLYGVEDPDNPGKMLNLKELVDRGIVNEVWFFARQGKYGAPYECTEVKQMYNTAGNKLPGKFTQQAGNGDAKDQPFIGRSLRILWLNPERGPGSALESLGLGLEGTSKSGAIPYFTRYFTEFAGFDLKKRFNLPFDSLYERNGSELDYPQPDQIKYTWQGKPGKFLDYYTVGGNVHFTPNARHDDDLENTEPVLSTIEHYRLKDGPDERDLKEPWSIRSINRFKTIAPDSQGPWMVYWRQNFPGFNTACLDDYRKPMKSWWPFLFY